MLGCSGVMLLCGCATIVHSEKVRVPVPAFGGQTWSIDAVSRDGVLSDTVKIRINGSVVGTVKVGAIVHEAEFSTTYRDQIVLSSCVIGTDPRDAGQVTCSVFVDGRKVADIPAIT